jgi:hypothetical protein
MIRVGDINFGIAGGGGCWLDVGRDFGAAGARCLALGSVLRFFMRLRVLWVGDLVGLVG